MAERSALVEGGTHKNFTPHPGTFLTHTLPLIHKNTIVVAATHPSVHTGAQTDDGWFLSDFYAFNYLLKGTVSDQTWLTAADRDELLSRWGDYLHGSPLRDRKVVLDKELLHSEITPVTLVSPGDMIDRFVEEVAKASTRAKRNRCPLLIMAFCHGIGIHHLLLDSSSKTQGLSMVRLQGALDPGVPVTLLTTACYSGGWVVSPDLNITAMTVAQADTTSLSWQLSDSIGRACGSVFVGSTLSALLDASTPLLSQDDSLRGAKTGESCLQPEEPTNEQTLTYNAFCGTIKDTLENCGLSRILGDGFSFSAQNDNWEYSWTEVSGIPLAYFRDRWEKLRTYPCNPPQGGGEDESSNRYTGGPGVCVNNMTRQMIHLRVYGMAELFYKLCPGDWQGGQDVALGGNFFKFLRNRPDPPLPQEISNVIFFRWDTCLLVDRFISDNGLPRPNDEICVMWHRLEYLYAKKEELGRDEWDRRYGWAWKSLFEAGATIEPADHQGPPFSRPLCYVAAAIAEKYTAENDAAGIVRKYCDYVARIRSFHLDRVIESPAVRRRGRDWIRSIGRRVRRSLSPSKSSRPSFLHETT